MATVEEWMVLSQKAIIGINPNLVEQFETLIAFLIANPEAGTFLRGIKGT